MALDSAQKTQVLQGLLDSVEMDIFRQEAELAALNAEAAAVTDENQKRATQQGIDNVSQALTRLRARQQAWQEQSENL